MKSILRAVALTAVLGAGTLGAQAQVGVYFGARMPYGAVAVAVPPCPGPGYVWSDGYYEGPDWIPGRWIDQGAGYGYYGGYAHDGWRDHDGWRGREDYRHFDGDRYRHEGYRGSDGRDGREHR